MSADWDIEALGYDELIALNRRVAERIRHLQAVQSQYLMLSLYIGQRVSFDAGPQHGGHLFATVIKRNRKTVGLVSDDGNRWNVSPHLIRPLKDVTPSQPASTNAKKGRQRGR